MTTNQLCDVCGTAAHWYHHRSLLCVTCRRRLGAVAGDGWAIIPDPDAPPANPTPPPTGAAKIDAEVRDRALEALRGAEPGKDPESTQLALEGLEELRKVRRGLEGSTTRRDKLRAFAEELESTAVSKGGVQADIPEGSHTVVLSTTFAVLIAQEIKAELGATDRLTALEDRVSALEALRLRFLRQFELGEVMVTDEFTPGALEIEARARIAGSAVLSGIAGCSHEWDSCRCRKCGLEVTPALLEGTTGFETQADDLDGGGA